MHNEDDDNRTSGQDLPDRAEEKRVDVPQNETAAPTEQAQANQSPPDAGPVEQSTGQVSDHTETTRTETHTESAPAEQGESKPGYEGSAD